jgi:hypothetical protein
VYIGPLIPQAVREGYETVMVDTCLPEIRLAKADVDNSIIIHQLTDALSHNFARGDVGALDLGSVQV